MEHDSQLNKNKKIPRYILKAIHDRARYADKFTELDLMISQWCDVNCGPYNVECTWGYVDTLTNPYDCEQQTIKEIEKHLK